MHHHGSTTLSLSSSDELGAQLLLGNFDDHYTCVVADRKIVDGRHLMTNEISHYYDRSFLMSTSQLKEKILPTTYLQPYWFNLVIDTLHVVS